MPKSEMQPVLLLLLLLLLLQQSCTHVSNVCHGFSVSGLNSLRRGDLEQMARVCSGKIGECSVEMEEGMDSESNRRMLVMQQKNYISYGTLKRDMVPCTTPGSSYYNCRGQANPYNRGCEVITGCARSISDIKS